MIRPLARGEEADYLAGLNTCFPGWGGERRFDWCFRRTTDAPAADLFASFAGDRMVAGTAVTYRKVRLPRGETGTAAIMTGSWTLPEARGRGLFGQMVELSRRQARRQGCVMLLAFGAAANGSSSTLRRTSVAANPAHYLNLAVGVAAPVPGDVRELAPEEALAAFDVQPEAWDAARMAYSAAAWKGQMLERPEATTALALPTGLVAIVERTPGVIRLLDVSTRAAAPFADAVASLAGWAASQELGVFAYTLDEQVAGRLVEMGFSPAPGALYQIACLPETPTIGRWWIANGDRM